MVGMKAARYKSYGGPDVIDIVNDAPQPILKEGQVLVEVHAAGLNPFDSKLRLGYMKENIPLSFPVTIGGDFGGVVLQTVPGVEGLSVGDAVYGQSVATTASGAIAEMASANVKKVAKKPQHVDFKEAAALVLVGVSSVQALEEHMKLTKGQKILIHGGAGGIGSVAIQLAKYLGAYVVTTVGSDDLDFVKKLGADEIIDYKKEKFEEKIHDFDAVYDTVGGETLEKSFLVLKAGGVLVTMVGAPDQNSAQEKGITAIGQATGTTTKRLDRLSELIEKGVIKPQIDTVFSLDETAKAYEYLENSHPKGKVVVKIKE
jgi:alcohol dehydrogenase